MGESVSIGPSTATSMNDSLNHPPSAALNFHPPPKPIEIADEKPEANLVMDLSSREEQEQQHEQRHEQPPLRPNGLGEDASGADVTGNDDEMDDAGIYGDMAEGDMVAAMLEEAQIPRSQFLGLNAEEKQKLLEARRTCKFCGKVCIKRSDLQRHLLVHTGERPWLCKVSWLLIHWIRIELFYERHCNELFYKG